MIKTPNFITLCTLLLIVHTSVFAQETNYWFVNFGASSTLKGGIDVAGVRNVAGIFYNPGALAFMEGEYFEGQADLFSMDILNIENGGGDGVHVNALQVDISPSLFAYLRKIRKNKKFGYALGILTRYNSNYSFIIEHEQEGNYLLPVEEVEVFQGRYTYDNRARESWVIGSFSYRVNAHIGIGMATNIFVRSQDYVTTYQAKAFPKDELSSPAQQYSKVTSTDDIQKLTYRVPGLIFKPGINLEYDQLKMGFTLTTPGFSLNILRNDSHKSQYSITPDATDKIHAESNSHTYYGGVYKTPLSLSVGTEYQMSRTTVAVALEWFSKVDKYALIKHTDESEDLKHPNSTNPEFAIPVMANKSILNAGISVMYKIKESISYIGSIRTDFSYFDDSVLDRSVDFVPNVTYWDVYHITSGIALKGPRAELTLGINYGFGYSKNDKQFVNMTSAAQSNFLRGNIGTNTTTRYHNISFAMGFNVDIDKGKGLKTDKI